MSLNDYNKKSQRLSSGDAKEKMKLGQAHLSEMVQHAESTIQWAETHTKLRMDKAKSVLQTAKSGKATDPVRMARDLHAAVLGPLVFATADEFIKDGKSFRTDLSKGELALVKRNLASSPRQARMIYDWEFTRGLNRTLYPELPSDIILRALSIASGPEAVVLENGIFRDLTQSKDLQNEKDGNLLNYFQKQAITCIAISSIAPTRFSKLLDSIGYNAAHAMVGEYVAGDIKNWPIHRAGANTAVSDRDEFRGGMLFSELTTMRTDKHMKRVRDHGYSYPRVNFWANPILLTNKAIEAALEIPLGEALSGKKPGELPASDVARLQTAYTKQIGLQNTIYLELINGLRAALKNEQGIDFASLDKKIKTAQSPVAKRYYQRARYFLALVNDLSGVMKKNISKDLTSGTVPGLYANPHRTFELLHGVMASAQDGDKAERDYKPKAVPVAYEFTNVRVERLGFTGKNSTIFADNLGIRDKSGKHVLLDEYNKTSRRNLTTQNFITRFIVFIDLPEGTYVLNPAYVTTNDKVREALINRGIQKWIGKVVDGVVYKTVRGNPEQEFEIETVNGKPQPYFNLDNTQLKQGKHVPIVDVLFKKAENEVTIESNETRIDGVPYPTRAVHAAAYPVGPFKIKR